MIIQLIVGAIIGIVVAEVVILVVTLFYDNVLCRPEKVSHLVRASKVQKVIEELEKKEEK